MPNYSWKSLVVTFFVVLNFRHSFGSLQFQDGKECLVYKVFKNGTHQHGVKFKFVESTFTVGFLRLNSEPNTWQIFVYLESKVMFEILINEERFIVIRQNDQVVARSDNSLPLIRETPSWYTLQVYLRNNEISIYSPDSLAAIVRGSIKENINENILKIKITCAKGVEYVTLNCLSKCPIFRGEDHGTIQFNLSTSFNLILRNGDSNNIFRYKIEPSRLLQNQNVEQSLQLNPNKNGMLSFRLMPSKPSNNCYIEINNNSKVPQLGSSCSNPDFIFTVFRNPGVSWSFYCEYKNYEKGSLPRNFQFGSGELVAWIIATLSICGFFVVIIVFYGRMNRTSWGIGSQENADSVSQLNNFELTTFPKTKQSTFFKELRKPEEASVLDVDKTSINLDKLYPLKFEAEDNIVEKEQNEEYFSTLRSNKTTCSKLSYSGSQLSHSGSQKYSSHHRSGTTRGQTALSDPKRINESTNN